MIIVVDIVENVWNDKTLILNTSAMQKLIKRWCYII